MTIAGVLFLAVLDSINPSAIVVTLYLLSTAGSRVLAQVSVYVATIFVTYLLLGVLMMLGIGALLPSVGAALDGQPGFILQSIAVAVAATGMSTADESKLFRFTIKHSVLLMILMGIISMLYAYVFPGWVPVVPPKP